MKPKWSAAGYWIAGGVLAAVIAFFIPAVRSTPLLYGIAALIAFWIVSSIVAQSANPFIIAVGADGKLSASKFQFFVWTGTVVFAYVWIAADRALGQNHDITSISSIPPNVMLAMGFSVVTLAGAKGITTSQAQNNQISKPQQTPTGDPAELLANDNGAPDLSKIQMLIWTLIAVCLYLLRVVQTVHESQVPQALPDIDSPLMVLMGLGHAAYLGNKLTTSDVSTLAGLNPTMGKPPCQITVSGSKLSGMAVVVCTIGGQTFQSDPINVAAGGQSLAFTMPAKIGTRDLVAADRVDVSLIVDGVRSANSLTFVVQ